MARKTGTLRGFGVLLDWWVPKADSDYTFAVDLGPGSATAQTTDARGVPQVLLAQTQPLVFSGSRAGGNPSATDEGGAYAWYLGTGQTRTALTEDDGVARHHLPPLRVTGAQLLDTVGGSDFIRDAVAFPLSGRVMVSSAIGTGAANVFRLYDPHDDSWSAIPRPSVPTTPAAYTNGTDEVALAVIPGTETVLAIVPQGMAFRSHDYGTTWQLYSWFPQLDDPLGGYDYDFVRAAFDGAGNLLLVAKRDSGNTIDLYYSTDLGASWTAQSASVTAKRFDVAASPDGTIAAVYIDATDDVYFRRLGGATTEPADTVARAISDGSTNYNEVAIGVDDDGTFWVYYRDATAANVWTVAYSEDFGVNWTEVEDAVMTDGGGAVDRIFFPKVVFSMGRACLVSGWAASAGAGSVALWLGGWEGPCYDSLWATEPAGLGANYPTRERAYRWWPKGTWQETHVWAAMQTPATYNGVTWTDTTAGAGSSVALDASYTYARNGLETFASASSATAYTEETFGSGSGSAAGYNDHYWEWEVVAATDHTRSTAGGAGARITSPALDYAIEVSAEGFDVYDVIAGSVITSVSFPTTSTANLVRFRCRVDTGLVTLLYQVTDVGTDAYWTHFEKLTFTPAATGLASGLRVRLGVGTRAATSAAQDVRLVHTYFTVSTDWSSLLTDDQPPELCEGASGGWGKAVGPDYGYPIPDASDAARARVARYTVTHGPILTGDVSHVDALSAYPHRNAYPTVSPSPAEAHRFGVVASTDYTLGHRDIDADNTSLLETPLGQYSWLVCAQNCNVRLLQVQAYTSGAGAWTTLATMDLATGFTSLSFDRGAAHSRVLRPDTSGSSGARYVYAGELAGGHVILDPGGTPIARRVKTNTAGWWDASAVGSKQHLTITLDGIDGTEPVTGTCHVVWPSGVMAIHDAIAAGNLFTGVRVLVAHSQTIPDSYHRVGDVGVYGLVVPGKQWGHGWEETLSPNVRIVENDYGTQWRTQRGPMARRQSLTWDHGARSAAIDGQSTGDYYGPAADRPLAADQDVEGQIRWLWEVTKGGALPVVTLFQVPADGVTVTDRRLWMAGYLDGTSRLQEAAGRSGRGVDSFYRIGPITIVERV